MAAFGAPIPRKSSRVVVTPRRYQGPGLDPYGLSPRVARPMSTDRKPEGSASQRIAFGTLARSTGEVVGKLASLAFFVVVARQLGEEQFGDLVFGMSLSTVLLLVAGLGMQEMIGREVAKDPRRADDLVWNVVVIKALMMIGLLLVIVAVVALHGPLARERCRDRDCERRRRLRVPGGDSLRGLRRARAPAVRRHHPDRQPSVDGAARASAPPSPAPASSRSRSCSRSAPPLDS